LDDYPTLPTHKPLFDRVIVDREGHTWLRDSPLASFGQFDARLQQITHPPEVWQVFDEGAVWLGAVTLPGSFELRAVEGRKIFGVLRDAFGIETIGVYGLLNR
jgi:hypothetical protein